MYNKSMLKKTIAVLLLLSIVLSSCGKKDKDKSNDFVRVVPESPAPAETPASESPAPAESPAPETPTLVKSPESSTPPPESSVPAETPTPASVASPASVPVESSTPPPETSAPAETSTPASVLVETPGSQTPAPVETPTCPFCPESPTCPCPKPPTPTICDRLPLCPSARDSRFMYYWTYEMFYIRGFAITPNNVFWTLFFTCIGFKMPIFRWMRRVPMFWRVPILRRMLRVPIDSEYGALIIQYSSRDSISDWLYVLYQYFFSLFFN